MVGQRMSRYIVDGGPFDRACAVLLAADPHTCISRWAQ
jgi:hypothetical protein